MASSQQHKRLQALTQRRAPVPSASGAWGFEFINNVASRRRMPLSEKNQLPSMITQKSKSEKDILTVRSNFDSSSSSSSTSDKRSSIKKNAIMTRSNTGLGFVTRAARTPVQRSRTSLEASGAFLDDKEKKLTTLTAKASKSYVGATSTTVFQEEENTPTSITTKLSKSSVVASSTATFQEKENTPTTATKSQPPNTFKKSSQDVVNPLFPRGVRTLKSLALNVVPAPQIKGKVLKEPTSATTPEEFEKSTSLSKGSTAAPPSDAPQSIEKKLKKSGQIEQPLVSALLAPGPEAKDELQCKDTVTLRLIPTSGNRYWERCVGKAAAGLPGNIFACPVCDRPVREFGGTVSVLPCGHAFCGTCVLPPPPQRRACPLCRAPACRADITEYHVTVGLPSKTPSSRLTM